MKTHDKLNQENAILELAQQRGNKGFYVYELITPKPLGLGIAQYNARIKGLRDRGYNIPNITPGFFALLDNPLEIVAIKEALKPKQQKLDLSQYTITDPLTKRVVQL